MNINARPTLHFAHPAPVAPYLDVTDHDGIAPLDAQFGVLPRRAVPAAAEPALFGGDTGALFALLDAACVPLLAERLERDELERACLFGGKAADDLGAAAPWIVRLTPDTGVLRSMFTASGAASDLWGQKPGVFLRCHAPLAELRDHLRRLTRAQDDAGKWFFFRCADAEAMYHYTAMSTPVLGTLARFFQLRGCGSVEWILPVGSRLRALRPRYRAEPTVGPLRLTGEEFNALREGKWRRFLDRVVDALRADGIAFAPPDVAELCALGFGQGFRVEQALYLYVNAHLRCRAQGRSGDMVLAGLDRTQNRSQMELAEMFYRAAQGGTL